MCRQLTGNLGNQSLSPLAIVTVYVAMGRGPLNLLRFRSFITPVSLTYFLEHIFSPYSREEGIFQFGRNSFIKHAHPVGDFIT